MYLLFIRTLARQRETNMSAVWEHLGFSVEYNDEDKNTNKVNKQRRVCKHCFAASLSPIPGGAKRVQSVAIAFQQQFVTTKKQTRRALRERSAPPWPNAASWNVSESENKLVEPPRELDPLQNEVGYSLPHELDPLQNKVGYSSAS